MVVYVTAENNINTDDVLKRISSDGYNPKEIFSIPWDNYIIIAIDVDERNGRKNDVKNIRYLLRLVALEVHEYIKIYCDMYSCASMMDIHAIGNKIRDTARKYGVTTDFNIEVTKDRCGILELKLLPTIIDIQILEKLKDTLMELVSRFSIISRVYYEWRGSLNHYLDGLQV